MPTAAPSLLLQAALDVVAYLRAAARALHAGQAALPKNSVSHMLALQIHLLRHLMPLPLVCTRLTPLTCLSCGSKNASLCAM